MKLGTGLKMVDEYPWMFPMVANALNLHKKTDLIAYAKCGPTHLELEEVHRLLERMEMQPSDIPEKYFGMRLDSTSEHLLKTYAADVQPVLDKWLEANLGTDFLDH